MNKVLTALAGAAAFAAAGSPALAQDAAQAATAAGAGAIVPPPPVVYVDRRDLPSDPAKMAEANAIIEIMYPPAERDATFHKMMGEVRNQFAASINLDAIEDAGLRKILEDSLAGLPDRLMPTVRAHLPRMFEATAIAYVDEFTLEELKELHAFARSPAGRHYLSKTDVLLANPAVAAANAAYFRDLQALQKDYQQGLMGEVATYLAAHPEEADKIAAAKDAS